MLGRGSAAVRAAAETRKAMRGFTAGGPPIRRRRSMRSIGSQGESRQTLYLAGSSPSSMRLLHRTGLPSPPVEPVGDHRIDRWEFIAVVPVSATKHPWRRQPLPSKREPSGQRPSIRYDPLFRDLRSIRSGNPRLGGRDGQQRDDRIVLLTVLQHHPDSQFLERNSPETQPFLPVSTTCT